MHTMPSLAMAPLAGALRFRPQALLRPGSVAVLAAGGAVGRRVMANLLASGFQGALLPVASARAVGGVLAYPAIADLPLAPDLAVFCGPAEPADFVALRARGTFAAVAFADGQALRAQAEATGVRTLGPYSFGIAVPAIGLDATTGHLRPRAGRLALVSQSAALCRTVLDWAEPNGVGFSHIVGVGANDDLGFATVLDWLSRDPGTGAILLDIRRLRDVRAFLSAARAASRLRPVVAMRGGGRVADPSGEADAAFAAALRRAGVLDVSGLEELLAAAETLTRAKPAAAGLAIVTNARGLGAMAADAALRLGIALSGDVAHAPADLAAAAARAKGGGVLVVHAPAGPGDAAVAATLAAAARTLPVPLLVCALGEVTGAVSRRALADAGVPVFASPEQAVRGFAHLLAHRRVREAARELPPSRVLEVAPDRAEVRRHFADPRREQRLELFQFEARALLAAYGLPSAAGPGRLRIRVRDDATFGPTIAIGTIAGPLAVGMPPLNLVLAHALLAQAAIPTAADPLADMLVRVSQLVVDSPELATLDILLEPEGVVGTAATLRPSDAPPRTLALPPYPADLAETRQFGAEPMLLRPIRPEDAEAHRAFFARLSPEDVRFRFFSAMRELSPEQMARMTQIDYDREMAFVVTRETLAGPQTVGVGRLVRDVIGPARVAATGERAGGGEFAIVVQPDVKGRGIASALMRRLIDWARDQGLAEITGQVLADNAPMLGFMRHLGFTIARIPGESDVVEARMELA